MIDSVHGSTFHDHINAWLDVHQGLTLPATPVDAPAAMSAYTFVAAVISSCLPQGEESAYQLLTVCLSLLTICLLAAYLMLFGCLLSDS